MAEPANGFGVRPGDVILGLMAAVGSVLAAAAFAAMLFTGALGSGLPYGLFLALMGSAVVGAVVALRSGFVCHIAGPQDQPAVILAAGVLGALPAGAALAEDTALSTMLCILVIASLAFGLALLLLGTFKLARFAQFIPYPVVGGFLAGTGWLLLAAGFRVASGAGLNLEDLGALLAWEAVQRWSPSLAVALAVYVVLRRTGKGMLLPVALILFGVVFHVIAGINGADVAGLQAGGWLFGPFAGGDTSQALTLLSLDAIDWSIVVGALGSIGALLVLGIMAALLNITALEIGAGMELDINREARAMGLANIVGAAVAGIPGYSVVSASLTYFRLGGKSRLVPLIKAGMCVLTAFVGVELIAYVPKIVVAALIFMFAIDLLMTWVVDSIRRMSRHEYLVILVILGAVVSLGFLPGVGVGILTAVILFVLNYSQVSVVQNEFTGQNRRSNVERSDAETVVLDEEGDRLVVFRLHGYIFFGTAIGLTERVKARHAASGDRLEYVMFSFRLVTGLDSSSVFAFQKLGQFARERDLVLMITNVSPEMESALRAGNLFTEEGGPYRLFPDFDYALEWVEDSFLDERPDSMGDTNVAAVLERHLGSAERALTLIECMEPMELSDGTALFRQGEEQGDIYFLEVGELAVYLEMGDGKRLRLRKFKRGTVVGEMTYYTGAPRSATIQADSACKVYRMGPEALQDLARRHPDIAASFHELMARLLAERVGHMNMELQTYRR